MIFAFLLFWYYYLHLATTTIDLNRSELQYLADHLHPEECRRLVASLHFKTYYEPKELDTAEASVSKDLPCIRLLLHWNSQKGEGKGETHEVVQHRLRQMGRNDLANWLGKTVFHQLGAELMENLNNPFEDIINVTEINEQAPPTLSSNEFNWNSTEWLAYDTVCWVFIVGLGIFAFMITCKAFLLLCKRKHKNRVVRPKDYSTLEENETTDSEED